MKKVTRSVLIPATIHELTSSEVKQHIGADRYDAIKASDDHPQFIEIVVGYEGISNGKVTVLSDEYDGQIYNNHPEKEGKQGDQKKEWGKRVIEQLAWALNFGTPSLVEGHKSPRKILGEVHSGYFEDREKRLTALGLGYVRDAPARTRINEGELDVASVEADILLAWDEEDEIYRVEEVRRVNAVALWDSEKNTPGFGEAGITAVINELQESATQSRIVTQETAIMNAADIAGKMPSDVFTRQQLLGDPVVKIIVRDETQTLNSRLDDTKVDLQKSTDRIKTLEVDVKTTGEKLKMMGMSANSARIGILLEAKVGALSASEKEKSTMLSVLKKRVRSDNPEISDSDLDTFVADAVKIEHEQLEQYRKLWGKKADAGRSSPTETEGKGGQDKEDGGEDDRDEFLKANKLDKDGNPLPKQDKQDKK